MAVASVAAPVRTESAPRRAVAVAGYLGGALLGVVLLVAVWAKAIDPSAFADQIRTEGLEILLPARAIAILVLALEAALGVALLLNFRRVPVLLTASALVLFFLFLTGRNWYRTEMGIVEPGSACGCFGNLVERTPKQAFVSDLLLLVPGLALAWAGRPGATRGLALRTGAAALAAGGTALFAWQAPSLPLDDLATRLKPGVELASICAGKEAERVCLTHLVPELAEGSHLVVLADVRAASFAETAEKLNAYTLSGGEPVPLVLADFTADEQRNLFWTLAPAFDLHETPAAMLRPLYRTLPRSFTVVDGRVTETWAGLPPFAASAEGGSAGSPPRAPNSRSRDEMNRKTAAVPLLLTALALAAPLAAQPADAFLSGFLLSGDYVVEIGGQEQPKAELYYSERARSFLIRSSELPSPILISPAAREVQSLDLMKVAVRTDGSIDILADAALAPEGGFRVVDDSIVFRAAGKDVRLKPRPWLLGAHRGQDLLAANPEYRRRADEYRPDAKILDDLSARKANVRVLTFFGSWCPHCKKHVPQLLKVSETLAKAGWQFDFYGLPSPIGDEPEAKKFSINGVPTAIVFVDGREVGRVPAALWTQPEAGLRSVLDTRTGGAK